MKIVVLLIFLLLISPSLHASGSGIEANIGAGNAQCARYLQEECALEENGIKRFVRTGNYEFDCTWNQDLNRCMVNPETVQDLERTQEQGIQLFNLIISVIFALIFVVPFLFFLKFAKSKILNIIYGAKIGIIILLIIMLVLNFDYYTTATTIIPLVILLEPVLSGIAYWKASGEQEKVKFVSALVLVSEIVGVIGITVLSVLLGLS